jgi:hypothetical protein
MITQGNTQPTAPVVSHFKFNVRDAGTLIGLLIIILTFSFLSPVFFTLPNLAEYLAAVVNQRHYRSRNDTGHYLWRNRFIGYLRPRCPQYWVHR